MKFLLAIISSLLCISCNKVINIELPEYEPQLVFEMYLEDGKPLRCLISESLPYTDTLINKPVHDLIVRFSDGEKTFNLSNGGTIDYENGRYFNYSSPSKFVEDLNKIYSVSVSNHKRILISASTAFVQSSIKIKKISIHKSEENNDKFSVGAAISDDASSTDYYRFIVKKMTREFESPARDLMRSDEVFNGEEFSFFSPATFLKNDTVSMKIYSLHPQHYNFLRTVEEARNSNYNPFSQPGTIASNIMGGIGIFTTIRADEKVFVIK